MERPGSHTTVQHDNGRPHPVGGVLALAISLLALFPGSAALGVTLANWLAPGSWVAQIAGFFALPLAFITGLQMWIGMAIFGAIFGVIVRLLAFRRFPPRVSPGAATILPGSFVFLPLSSTAGLLAGIVTALVPSASSAILAIVVFWLSGTLHGLAAWMLARYGVLVPPDSM